MRKNVYIVGFFTGFNLTAMLLALPLYSIDRFCVSSFQTGILGFFLNFLYSLNTFLTGRTFLKDKRASLIKFSLFVIVFLFPSFLFLPSFPFVIALFGLYGILQAWVWPVLQASLSSAETEELPKVLGNYNIAWSSGNILGMGLAGKLYQIKPFLPFFVTSLISLISFLLVKGISIPPQKEDEETDPLFHPYYLKVARIFNFFNFAIFGTVIFLFPKLGRNCGFSPFLIGLLLSSIFAGRSLFFVLWRFVTFWKYKFSLLFLCPFLSIISLLLLGLMHTPSLFLVSFLLLAISLSLTYSSSLLASIDRKMGGAIASEINESIIGAGFFSGPLVGGFISRYLSLPHTFLSLTFFVILGEIAGIYLYLKGARR